MAGARGATSSTILKSVASRIGHEFAAPALLELALRHRSWCAEHGAAESNERLEFLGDAVLGLIVAESFHALEPQLPEAAMSRRRSELVNSYSLADLARSIDLGDAVLLGKGEESTGGRDKVSILADALEAVIGAVYLDGGLAAAGDLVGRLYGEALRTIDLETISGDDKSRLQELTARRSLDPPRYLIDEEGPDHAKHFDAVVEVDGKAVGRGRGRTKKEAEQAAAHEALALLLPEANDAVSGDADGGNHARTT